MPETKKAVRLRRGFTFVFSLLVFMTSCQPFDTYYDQESRFDEMVGNLNFEPSTEARPTGLKPYGVQDTAASPGATKKRLYPGNDRFVSLSKIGAAPEGTSEPDGGIQINFQNTQLREVAAVILRDTLGLSFVYDPRVEGSVTVSTNTISREHLLATLETLLRMNGAALVVDEGIYRIVPIGDALAQAKVRQLGTSTKPMPSGFGISILQLRHVSAANVARLVEPIAALPGGIRIDPARNVILLAGSGGERRALMETISAFDVDWLAGMSAGIFPLTHTKPDILIPELEAVFGIQNQSPLTGLVQFVPIDRMNGILVVTPQVALLRQAEAWIGRLDQGNVAGLNLYVYFVQHGKATDLAQILNDTFSSIGSIEGGGNGASSLGRVAPNLSPVTLSSAAPTAARVQPAAVQGSAVEAAAVQASAANAGGGGAAADTGAVPAAAAAAAPAAGTGAATSPAAATQTPLSILPGGTGRLTAPAAGTRAALRVSDLGEIRIIPDEVNNSLLILATPAGYQMVEAALRQLDVVPLQVLIEATIAEVSLNDSLQYGVQFSIDSGNVTFGNFSGTTQTLLGTFPGFNFFFNGGDVKAVIDALESITDVKVLSSPQLVVLDNQAAELQVGDEVPVATRQSTSLTDSNAPAVNEIEFRDTGVILRVKPRINASGLVSMEVEQEVSSVSTTSTTGSLTPTISQRRVTSSIAVNSGQTVVLGGLISETVTDSRSGIPVLSRIPVVGGAFGRTNDSIRRTELIIFITPRVIRNPDEAQRVAEELHSRLRSLDPRAFGNGRRGDEIFHGMEYKQSE